MEEANRHKEKTEKVYEKQKQQIQEEQKEEMEKVMKNNYKLKQQYLQQKDIVSDLNNALMNQKEMIAQLKKVKHSLGRVG